MDGERLSGYTSVNDEDIIQGVSVCFYETGWTFPRKVVAVGNLDKVWLVDPVNFSLDSFNKAFQSYFGAEWMDILDSTDISFSYNAANNAYFSICDLHTIEDLTLDQLLKGEGVGQLRNIIVS